MGPLKVSEHLVCTRRSQIFTLFRGFHDREACLAPRARLFCLSRPRRPTTQDARCARDPENTLRSPSSTRALYPRSPYARQRHDALLCCHAHAPHYRLPLLPHRLCHSAATALFRTATAATCTLMAANKEERAASLFRRSPEANFPTSETHAPRPESDERPGTVEAPAPVESRDRRSPRARQAPGPRPAVRQTCS